MADDAANKDCKDDKDIDNNSVCRDFLRNVCRRGKYCRYQHLDQDGNSGSPNGRHEFVFCHDFQNKSCDRNNCMFIHCTREEEEFYRTTGELPTHVLDVALRKGLAPVIPLGKGEVPICKDNLKGDCKRGGKCKFRHLTLKEYECELYGAHSRRRDCNGKFDDDNFDSSSAGPPPSVGRNGHANDVYDPPEPKRRHLEDHKAHLQQQQQQQHQQQQQPPPQQQHPQQPQQCVTPRDGGVGFRTVVNVGGNYNPEHGRFLEDENLFLRKKVEELRKQVHDLTATNEFLLDQNAQLRLMKPVSTSGTTVTVSPVTLASTITTPVSVPTIAQISGTLPLQNAIGMVGATGQPPTLDGPQVAVAAPAVMGSVATVQPVSLSGAAVALTRVSPMTSITPVSLNQPVTPMSSIATVSLTQPVPTVTISGPLPPAAAGTSLSINTINSQSNPMVSYPVMTQGMRPIIPAANMTR